MPDEVPTPLKGVYIFVEMLALGAVLKAFDEFEKQHYLWGFFFIILGAIFLSVGIAGLSGWLKRSKRNLSVEVIEALYGAGEFWVDATKGVRHQLGTHGGVVIAETATLHVADPAFGEPKELRIRYKNRGKELRVAIPEHGYLTLGETPKLTSKWDRQSVSKLADLVMARLNEVYEATSQRLPFSELADKFTDAVTKGQRPSIRTVHEIEAEIIADCNDASRDQNWIEFRELAKQLVELNAKLSDFNAAPSLAKASKIMEQSHQTTPPIAVKIHAQINSRFP
jgi:hypothetical protein